MQLNDAQGMASSVAQIRLTGVYIVYLDWYIKKFRIITVFLVPKFLYFMQRV